MLSGKCVKSTLVTSLDSFPYLDFRSSSLDWQTDPEEENLWIQKSLLKKVIHKTEFREQFQHCSAKVTLSPEPHYLPVCVAFPGDSPNSTQTQACGRFKVLSTNRVAGACLVIDIYWLWWSLRKCQCKLFRRQWRRNGRIVPSTPSSRYSSSGVSLPVVLSYQIALSEPLFI